MPLSNHIAAGRRRGENALEGAPGASGGGWGARSASGSRAATRAPAAVEAPRQEGHWLARIRE